MDLGEGFDPFGGPAIELTAPSTESQREIWAAVQMGPQASCAFNESNSLRLRGPLDADALRSALQDLVERHEALRTTFSADGAQILVSAATPIELALTDLSSHSDRAGKVAGLLAAEVSQPFALERGPLFRARLLRVASDEHLLVLTAHHIVCDGYSAGVLLRELATLYRGHLRGSSAALAKAPRFSAYARQFAEWSNGPAAAAARDFWQRQFATVPPDLDFPSDRPRPPLRTYRSAREDVLLDAQLVDAVRRTGARAGASLFATLLAAFDALLYRLTGQSDLVVAIPAAGQSVAGFDGLVGHCVNTLPIRASVADAQPFTELLRSVRKTMLDALEQQQFTFGKLLQDLPLQRDPSRLPLVSVMFNLDQALSNDAIALDGLEVAFSSNARSFENFDLFVNAVQTKAGIVLEIQYASDLFDAATIRRWFSSFTALLRASVERPETAVGALRVLSDEDRALLHAWNDTDRDYPRDRCAHELIFAQAERVPDAVAVVFGGSRLTYRELGERARAFAARLTGTGLAPGDRIGICVERSLEMVVAMLAVLEAGGTYVPLDPGFPAERLAFMVEDARLSLVIADRAGAARLGTTEARLVDVQAASDKAPDVRSAKPDPERAAYVLYTSGSTGKPKGVCVSHRALVNFLCSVSREPGLTAADVVVAVTTLSFDIAALELLLPLLVGARVVIASREVAGDGALLRGLLESEGATALQATPSTWRLLLATGFRGSPAFKAICGGEALPRDLADDLLRISGSAWNMYGPTETTVWSTCHRIEAVSGPVPIGRPIANTEVHVLDERLQPVPIGVAGELYIGGDGIAAGYLHRPELTAERFIPDPFRGGAARMYRTGDLGRWTNDGVLRYLGRNDSQVKVRGHRIELGEIETALARASGVVAAVAAARELAPGDVRLVAYVVPKPGANLDAEKLREMLRRLLPEYMVPQHFVELPSFPLTPNGKIDRKALPSPVARGDGAATFLEPRTATERLVADIWRAVLSVDRVGVNDDFFTMGGHSLLAAQVAAALARDHAISVPLRRMFEAPTVAQLAASIDAERGTVTRLERSAASRTAPLSLMQQRLWFLDQLEPGETIYNLSSAFRLHGPLDVSALERALNETVRRHEPMRTTLHWQGDRAVQVIAPELVLALEPVTDLSDAPDRERKLLEALQSESDVAFDLSRGPLVRARLFRLGSEDHVFFFMPHHAIWDGWSFDVFLRELATLYEAFATGRPSPLPELPIRYADFARWQRESLRGEELERQARFWQEQLSGELPVLQLPADRPRPPTMHLKGDTVTWRLDAAQLAAVHGIGRRAEATSYMVMLAAFAALLHRHSGQGDLLIGTPVRGRNVPETEDLIGFFVNTLVLRLKAARATTFLDLVRHAREVCLDAFSHPDMPFEELVRRLDVPRDLSRTPVFQAFFSYQNTGNREARLGPLPYTQIDVLPAAAATDLTLWVKEAKGGLVGGFTYNTDLFDRSTVERLGAQLQTLLSAAAREPETPLGQLPLLPEAEQTALRRWNATGSEYPRSLCLHELLAKSGAEFASSVAVASGGVSRSYRELHDRARRLAARLRSLGVRRGVLVGVCVERSIDMVVALLAILEAGGAYVPLDPAYPRERLAFMISDSQMPVLLTESRFEDRLPPSAARVLRLDLEPLADGPAEPLAKDSDASRPEDPAYVIYTSGSTGKPKGVRVPHRAVVNFLCSAAREPGLTASDSLLAVTTLSFDIAGLELFLPLLVGARVVVASRETAQDGARLLAELRREKITAMQATPSTWRMLIASGWEGDPAFKAICGGEALPPDLANELSRRCGSAFNMYGPTETTIWSTCHRLAGGPVSIGRPLANTQTHVLDPDGQPAPIGVPGELHIGGDGVALGYLNRPELTAERFVPDPFRAGGTLYKTGDFARWRADGTLEFLGRNDGQVKLRGFRIELGEVEAALLEYEGIAQAVAAVRELRAGDTRLVAYTVPRPGEAYTDTELRRHLRARLPEHMVPQLFVECDRLPLTPNGKIDRKALPAPDAPRGAAAEEWLPPRTATERLVAEVWRQALAVPRVGLHDNFFNLGGHSLLCLEVIAEIEKFTGQRLSPRTFLLDTLQQVAASLPDPAIVTGAAPVQPLADRVLGGLRRVVSGSFGE